MKFSYKKIDGVVRPVIPIEIHHGDVGLRYEVLVDSGADMNIMSAEIAEALGIDVKSGEKKSVGGITGERQPFYVHNIQIRVGGWVYSDVEVGFMLDMPNYGYGVVGQRGFFEFFKVIFDLQKEEIELKLK